jgi:hypothetical protein
MSTATKLYRVNVCAFIMTHGIVTPEKNPAVQPVGLQPTHYRVTTTLLPSNIKLYAPAILGYSYYEDKQTENIVKEAAQAAQRYRSLQVPHQYIAQKFLDDLQQFVKYKISRLNRYLSLVALPHGYNRAERLDKQETTIMKTQMEWRRHSRYITEKKYQIYPDQDPFIKLPSCIMIYCDTVNENAMNIMNETFNDPNTTYDREKGEQITYTVNYDKESSTFKIDFGDTNVDDVTLNDIIFLINNLIVNVVPDGTKIEQIMLSIFDMTCDDLSFPNISAAGERPVLLSSVNSPGDPYLVYGTIQESRALQIERETQTFWPSLSSRRDPWGSYQLEVESVSPSPSRSTSTVLSDSQSPAAASPSNTHVVHLLNGAESFVNFNLILECQPSLLQPSSPSVESTMAFASPSVSVDSSTSSSSDSSGYGIPLSITSSPESSQKPPHFDHESLPGTQRSVSVPRSDINGGRRRTICLTNKVSLRNRRRRTKAHSKRSKRQRKTKKIR